MITTTKTVTLITGEELTFPLRDHRQVWQIDVTYRHVDPKTGYTESGTELGTIHVDRQALEACGKLCVQSTGKREPTETVEDLIRRCLESLGVKFE